jgi:site-specific recombinase XerD
MRRNGLIPWNTFLDNKSHRVKREGQAAQMAWLLYGGGLRLTECTNLRIKDVDFTANQILTGDGTGGCWRNIFRVVQRTGISNLGSFTCQCYET